MRLLGVTNYDACYFCFFFNDPATTEIYTLSLHDALPILQNDLGTLVVLDHILTGERVAQYTDHLSVTERPAADRKSTRLNSSHANISYAVFCLKKKNNKHSNAAPNCLVPDTCKENRHQTT